MSNYSPSVWTSRHHMKHFCCIRFCVPLIEPDPTLLPVKPNLYNNLSELKSWFHCFCSEETNCSNSWLQCVDSPDHIRFVSYVVYMNDTMCLCWVSFCDSFCAEPFFSDFLCFTERGGFFRFLGFRCEALQHLGNENKWKMTNTKMIFLVTFAILVSNDEINDVLCCIILIV